jgi:hypothetical protein
MNMSHVYTCREVLHSSVQLRNTVRAPAGISRRTDRGRHLCDHRADVYIKVRICPSLNIVNTIPLQTLHVYVHSGFIMFQTSHSSALLLLYFCSDLTTNLTDAIK